MESTSESRHPSTRRYPAELNERAVRLVEQTRAKGGDEVGVIARVARQLGVGDQSLRTWVRQAEIDFGRREGLSSDERTRFKALEKENRELRPANEMLKWAATFFGAEFDRRSASDPLRRCLAASGSTFPVLVVGTPSPHRVEGTGRDGGRPGSGSRNAPGDAGP